MERSSYAMERIDRQLSRPSSSPADEIIEIALIPLPFSLSLSLLISSLQRNGTLFPPIFFFYLPGRHEHTGSKEKNKNMPLPLASHPNNFIFFKPGDFEKKEKFLKLFLFSFLKGPRVRDILPNCTARPRKSSRRKIIKASTVVHVFYHTQFFFFIIIGMDATYLIISF